ncbi:MAG: TPM domain-containing protein [Paludibacteraceae bacterium]|nr:TPM domain-containing protein [Paludibacteraceae bacterium]
MLRLRHLACLLAMVACYATIQAEAYTPATVPHPRSMDAEAFVSNPDAILSSAEVDAIQQVAQQLNQATGVEMVTVVLDDIGYADVFAFSLELFNSWGIGDRDKKNGVLILFALQSRDIRITTGGGLEGLLPDATCSRILYNEMIPLLSDGRYAEGLLAGNKAIARELTDQKALEELLLGYKRKPVTEHPWLALSIFLWILALTTLIHYWRAPRCPQCKRKGLKIRSELVAAATYTQEGMGIRHFTCPCCGHTWKEPYTTPKVPKPVVYSSGSGRGFGGGGYHGGGSFGGGSSFGGGAGGKF